MNKNELVERLAKDTGLTKADCGRVLDSCVKQIKKSVKKGEDVKLVGFGTFTKIKRRARAGVNPQTGQPIQIEATWVPKFRPGAEFKSSLG
jgi:DNA-binding protein HU-beta